MNGLLSFDDAPPLSVPARFFLTAPVYGVLAGLLILVEGDALLVSRWSPAVLTLTHLLTLGLLLQVMIGALFQFLPVAAGANIRHPRLSAGIVHPALNLGVLCLCGGFLFSHHVLLLGGAVALSVALGTFLLAALYAVWPVRQNNPTLPALKLALGGLLVTVLLGLYLLVVYAFGAQARVEMLTALHASWGLIGWSALLVIGVSFVVVPMFQLTPGYRARFSRWLAPVLMSLLLAWTLGRSSESPLLEHGAGIAMMLGLMAYAAVTLRLQALSKRPRADATVRFWQIGMACTLLAAGLWLCLPLVTTAAGDNTAAPVLALGGLAILGALVSVVSGMLYKIVPFLSWMHLQSRIMARGGGKVPHMGVFVSATATQRQLLLHLASLLLVGAGMVWPELVRFAGGVLVLSFLLLGGNLIVAVQRFRQLNSALVRDVAE